MKQKNSSKRKGYLKPKNPPATSYLYTVFPKHELKTDILHFKEITAVSYETYLY